MLVISLVTLSVIIVGFFDLVDFYLRLLKLPSKGQLQNMTSNFAQIYGLVGCHVISSKPCGCSVRLYLISLNYFFPIWVSLHYQT